MKDRLRDFYQHKQADYGAAPGADNAHNRILPLVGSGKRVLDVGCGSGHLGAAIKALGNEVTGVELAPEAAEKAGSVLDRVVQANIETGTLPLKEGSFDVVLCADILEHLFDPRAVLAGLLPYLRPGGQAIISLPNVAHFSVRLRLLRGVWEYTDIGILDRGHIRFFTCAGAEQMIEQAGLRVSRREFALSLPHAPPLTRRVIDSCFRLPQAVQQLLANWIAVQFVFVAEAREIGSDPA